MRRGSAIVYRMLLRLYPRAFRDRFASSMLADYEAMRAERLRSRGLRGAAGAWMVVLRDLARTVPLEWWRALAGRRSTRSAAATGFAAGRGARAWDRLAQDVGFAFRTLGRNRGFAAVVVAVMGVGIGATTIIFSALDRVVLRPLPFPEPDRLVRVYEINAQGQDFTFSQPDFVDFSERTRVFAALAAYTGESFALTGDGDPVRVRAQVVSHQFFDLLGGSPMLGRVFDEAEDRPGGRTHVAVLSEGLWERRFGRDPGVLGRTLVLEDQPYEVIGVMPASFSLGPADVWVPLAADRTYRRGDHRLIGIARLRPGITIERANEDVRRVAEELGAEYATNAGWSARMISFEDWRIGPELRRTLVVLLGAVGLLLLMACSNVSNLLLVRATTRRRELGVRWALGAERSRIARQLFTESVVLGVLGGVAGVVVARIGLPLLRQLTPAGVPRLDEVAIDARALIFSLVVSIGTGLVFGLAPVVQAVRRNAYDVLRDGGRTESKRSRGIRDILVIGQIALATVLLVGAGLLVESFRRLESVDAGYVADNILAVPVTLTGARYSACGGNAGQTPCDGSVEARWRFLRDVESRLSALSPVLAAGASSLAPLSGGSTGQDVNIEGRVPSGPADVAFAAWRAVSPGFFDALGLPIRGRGFTDADMSEGAPVIVVSESAAKAFWPGENPIGKRMAFGENGRYWFTVVGIAGDLRDVELTDDPVPIVYGPYTSLMWPYMTLLVRTRDDPALLADAVRAAIGEVDPLMPVPEMRTLDSYRSSAMAGRRFSMILMGVFAIMALALATLGVYGVITFSVSRRRREMGLRMALGAERQTVVVMVLRHGLVLAGSGVLIGSAVAFALSGLIQSLLFDTPPADPPVYVIVAASLVGVTLVSSLLPARRAARVDPRVALVAD